MSAPGARAAARLGLVTIALAAGAAAAAAQPLPGSPADPADRARVRLGPLALRPGLRVAHLGIDSNIFNEESEPRRDFVATLTPWVEAAAQTGRLRLLAEGRVDFDYFQRFVEERSVNRAGRGRLELRFDRLVPFLSGGLLDTRERPNSEIDRRARRRETTLGAGVGVLVGPQALVGVELRRRRSTFAEGEAFLGEPLDERLDSEVDGREIGRAHV